VGGKRTARGFVKKKDEFAEFNSGITLGGVGQNKRAEKKHTAGKKNSDRVEKEKRKPGWGVQKGKGYQCALDRHPLNF